MNIIVGLVIGMAIMYCLIGIPMRRLDRKFDDNVARATEQQREVYEQDRAKIEIEYTANSAGTAYDLTAVKNCTIIGQGVPAPKVSNTTRIGSGSVFLEIHAGGAQIVGTDNVDEAVNAVLDALTLLRVLMIVAKP